MEPDEAKKKPLGKRPSDIDREIGEKLRKWRLAQNVEAADLASKLGVTYQQLHKYEKGLTRISAARLYAIANTLEVPIGWFFRPVAMDGDGPQQSLLDPVDKAGQVRRPVGALHRKQGFF